MISNSGIVAQPDGERGRGVGGSQCRGGERSEPPRNGEPPTPRPSESQNKSAAKTNAKPKRTGVELSTAQIPDPPGAKSFAPERPDPEVLEKPVRRKFSAQYKQRIIEEADACVEQGQLGALIRREGLYSSYLSNWRRQRDAAVRKGLGAKKRGRRPTKNPLADEVKLLARENDRLKRELGQAKLIIDIQKKTSQLLGITLTDVSEHEKILDGEGND